MRSIWSYETTALREKTKSKVSFTTFCS